jgi:hypothetical protein
LAVLLLYIQWVRVDMVGCVRIDHVSQWVVLNLSRGQLLIAILFHYTVTWAGTLAEHLYRLMGIEMSDGTLSERRQALPFLVFEELLQRLLRPLHLSSPQAYYRHWRLTALDGVNFSLSNTAPVNEQCRDVRDRGRMPTATMA